MEQKEFFEIFKDRFEINIKRYPDLNWSVVLNKLLSNPDKLRSLILMEESGGEPSLIKYDKNNDKYIFFDSSPESPKGRRSLCYDETALNSRKNNKPSGSALKMAAEMGIELLTEEEYFELQQLGDFDLKTSSWLLTAENVRSKGGAVFGDKRYGRIFIYHNGAESYYGARGFRGKLDV